MHADLRKEYQQYIGEEHTEEEKKSNRSLLYRIDHIAKVQGEISSCFDAHMSPYTKKEEQDLVLSIRQELAQDLKDPVQSSIKTEDVGILNSSLLLFSKIKHLLKRASSISKSQILFNISQSIERAILDYLDKLQSHLNDTYKVMGQANNKSGLYNILNLKNLTSKS